MSDTPIFDQLKREYWLMDFMDAQNALVANFQRPWIEWAMGFEDFADRMFAYEQIRQSFHKARSKALEVGHAARKVTDLVAHIDYRNAAPESHYQIDPDGKVHLLVNTKLSVIQGLTHQGIIFDEAAPSYPWEDIHVGARGFGKSRAIEEARSQDEEYQRIDERLSMLGFAMTAEQIRSITELCERVLEGEKLINHRHHSMIQVPRKNPNLRIRKPQTRALGRVQSHRSRR